VSTKSAFHGRTLGALQVIGTPKHRDPYAPLLPEQILVPFDDLAAAKRAVDRSVAAFIVEPVQGEGGVNVPSPGYLRGLRELCDASGALLIFDEVQTGVGRTGKWFGHQHDHVEPDVMTLAKGLGGGVPIGAVVATEKAARGLAAQPGGAVPHASTFGGNALACAAAVAMIDIMESEGLVERVAQSGQYLAQQLGELVIEFPGHAIEIRGRGLLRGLAIAGNAVQVVARCREKGLLLSVAGVNVVRFAPPYIAERAHLDEAVTILRGVLAEGVGKAVS